MTQILLPCTFCGEDWPADSIKDGLCPTCRKPCYARLRRVVAQLVHASKDGRELYGALYIGDDTICEAHRLMGLEPPEEYRR